MVCYTDYDGRSRWQLDSGAKSTQERNTQSVGRANSVQPEKDLQKEAKRPCNLLALGPQCRDCD
ncbi:hypothetical protein T07_13897 [Trichinella nelsoni]|uniref:Uncharacterized protein n=1 Tax=Trichinella nelsoni TaxID=6336 RepID=A0A0V0SMD5_9BILA|nr:hypothetical protein T07_13897 [Trichinella nelsoni]